MNNSTLSDSDYQHYLDVVAMTRAGDLREYLELYLKLDVTQLADTFEGFRRFTLQNQELDPGHYSTLPGLAWDACLKMTKVELELVTDPDMYSFLEAGIRGGISVISKRAAKANNNYLSERDADEDVSYIMYYDGKFFFTILLILAISQVYIHTLFSNFISYPCTLPYLQSLNMLFFQPTTSTDGPCVSHCRPPVFTGYPSKK